MSRALILVCVLLASLAMGAAEPPPFPSGDPDLDRTIRQVDAEWQAAMLAGDAAKIAEPYEDDAVFVAADGTATQGRARIEALMRERFAHGGVAKSTRITPHRIVRDGDLAVELGVGEIRRLAPDGTTVASGGGYLTLWRRHADGWRIWRNVVLP